MVLCTQFIQVGNLPSPLDIVQIKAIMQIQMGAIPQLAAADDSDHHSAGSHSDSHRRVLEVKQAQHFESSLTVADVFGLLDRKRQLQNRIVPELILQHIETSLEQSYKLGGHRKVEQAR